MDLIQDHFPVFEVNQVLTSDHLNDVFNRLDEQERLTRANLIGIGIVCGLEISLDAGPAIKVSKGCGVTSQGYLVVEPEDLTLTSYRAGYIIPKDPLYRPFVEDVTTGANYPLWELFPDGEPNTVPLAGTDGFLDDKAVLLFMELKKEGLRNCSPNNCDDKGSEVTGTVKPLLVRRADLDEIIESAHDLGSDRTSSDLRLTLLEQLKLPDIRLPRFDVVNTAPAATSDIYTAFLSVFRSGGLAAATLNALRAAHAVFQPILEATYPADEDPFDDFATKFGFLDGNPETVDQVRFLQYYYDCFDDLLRAYDEFRWKGVELLCACCPAEGLFPCHLMLGLLKPGTVSEPSLYRNDFLPSAALGACVERTAEVVQLFRRLVEMTRLFTNKPSLPPANEKAATDPQIRITPSFLGDEPLSRKAIPYYYEETDTPRLYELWNFEKTRRNRANQNLSYRSDTYAPAAPAFVVDPLRYDIEPYNFLRIEGHLGKSYLRVLGTLLLRKAQYRLPVEIVALRTGAFDETQDVDLSSESARFQDLEALYDAMRAELLTTLTEGVMRFYDAPAKNVSVAAPPNGIPALPLLKNRAPSYRVRANSVGAWYEANLTTLQARPYIDVNQDQIDKTAVFIVYCQLFAGTAPTLDQGNYAHVVAIYYLTKLSEILPESLDALAYADFENKYEDLVGLVRFLRTEAIDGFPADLQGFIPKEELVDAFDEVLFSCKLDPIKSIHDEFGRRLNALKARLFLSQFLTSHPGVQHKAGVPVGGTFLLVYHQDPAPAPAAAPAAPTAGVKTGAAVFKQNLADIVDRLATFRNVINNPQTLEVLGALGDAPARVLPVTGGQAPTIMQSAIDGLADGTVIADFYLPYLISPDYTAVQFVLPTLQPTFDARVACTGADGNASLTIAATGGMPPYDIKIDDRDYQPLTGPLALAAGAHTLKIRDAEETESALQNITVAPALTLSAPTLQCSQDLGTYTATVAISGGTPPYSVGGTQVGNSFTTAPIKSGTAGSIVVTDSKQCTVRADFTRNCLPCSGIALRRGYLFFIPDSDKVTAYTSLTMKVGTFSFEFPQGTTVDLTGQIAKTLDPTAGVITAARLNGSFTKTIAVWVNQVNKLIAQATNMSNWLTLRYVPRQPGALGILWIEYFECLKLNFQITSTFELKTAPGTKRNLTLAYSTAGTAITGEVSMKLPAFDPFRTDMSAPGNPEVPLCKDPFATMNLEVVPSARGLAATASATVSPKPASYLWEAQDATPSMALSTGAKASFKFTTPGAKLVSVTAFTDKGCSKSVVRTVTVGSLG